MTQFTSHLVIYYHRKVEAVGIAAYFRHEESLETELTIETETKSRSTDGGLGSDDPPIALHEYQFMRPHRGESEPLYVRSSTNVLFGVVATLLIALLLFGYLLPSFSFENLGIVGIAIEFGQGFEEARQKYSISDIAQILMDQGRFLGSAADKLGHFSVTALLVASTLIVPYILIALLLFQLWYPFGSAVRRRVDVLVEGMAAWQYVDVYLLSVVVASWQVGDISQYLANPYCGSLEPTFAELVSYGIIDEDDAQCFSVRSMIQPAIYALVAAAVLLSLLMSFVTNAYRQLEYQSGTLARRRERQNPTDEDADLGDDELCNKIHPVPLLLTDRFRWLLRAGEK